MFNGLTKAGNFIKDCIRFIDAVSAGAKAFMEVWEKPHVEKVDIKDTKKKDAK